MSVGTISLPDQPRNAPAAAPTAPQQSLSVLSLGIVAQLWTTLVRHKWVILALAIAGVLFGVVATLVTPPVYRAASRLVFDPQQADVLGDSVRGRRAANTNYLDPMYDFSASGLLQSRSLAERVVRSLNLASSPYFANQKLPAAARVAQATNTVLAGTEVVPQRQTRLIDVYFRSNSAEMAAAVANGLSDNFIQQNIDRKLDQNSYARRYLRQQLEDTRGRLEQSERRLFDFQRVTRVITFESKSSDGTTSSQSMNNTELEKVAAQLSDATQRRIEAESKYRSQAQNPAGVREQGSGSGAQTELSQLRANLAQLRTTFGDGYPEIIAVKNRISVLEREVATGLRRGLEADEVAYRSAVAAERGLSARFNQLQNEVLGERSRNTEYTVLTRDVDTNRQLYDALLQRYKEVGVSGSVGDNNIAIVDRAQVPGGPIKPILYVNVLLGLLAGLAIGISGTFAYDTIRDVVTTPRDIESHLHLTALGAIPLNDEHESVADALSDPRSSLTEAYFGVANMLRFATPNGIPKSLLITSTQAQEGKSSSTYALARSIVPMGKRVLIVDADLRRPTFSLAQENGVKRDDNDAEAQGLMHLLTGQANVDQVIKPGQHGISFILAGGTPPNPSELFSRGKVAAIIEELTRRFDVVIVDAPPILGFVDAPVLASFVEATIIVFQSGRIRTGHAQTSIDRLRKAGANLVGGLITKYSKKGDEYGYGYGYDYDYDQDSKSNIVDAQRRKIVVVGENGKRA